MSLHWRTNHGAGCCCSGCDELQPRPDEMDVLRLGVEKAAAVIRILLRHVEPRCYNCAAVATKYLDGGENKPAKQYACATHATPTGWRLLPNAVFLMETLAKYGA